MSAAVLALGAPVGMLVLHAVRYIGANPGGELDFEWLTSELLGRAPDYAYVTLSTLLAFTLFGWFAGSRTTRLAENAATDSLTGLWNRRHLDERLDEELRRAARYRTPLSLLIIDVDRLKTINDRSGHSAGDEALKLVARAIAECCRNTDVPARYGGDEFAVLAPSTPGVDAVSLAERIRLAIEKRRFGKRAVSVSIGCADLTDVLTLDSLAIRQAADEALYQAKAEGRNRVVRLAKDEKTIDARPGLALVPGLGD